MRSKLFRILMGGGILALVLPASVYAQTSSRASNLQSEGVYSVVSPTGKSVTLDSADLRSLANQIDLLEQEYKEGTVKALSKIGITVATTPLPSFDTLFQAISTSQTPKGNDVAATVDNLSEGVVAYVNGTYLQGNGNDVNTAYANGYSDGVDYAIGHANVEFVYHVHVNGDGDTVTAQTVYTTQNPGGCYIAAGHTHNMTGTCSYYTTPIRFCGAGCNWTHYDDSGIHNEWKCSNGHSRPAGENPCQKRVSGGDKVYTCGSPVNTYVLGCGKTTSTIEQAIINFS